MRHRCMMSNILFDARTEYDVIISSTEFLKIPFYAEIHDNHIYIVSAFKILHLNIK